MKNNYVFSLAQKTFFKRHYVNANKLLLYGRVAIKHSNNSIIKIYGSLSFGFNSFSNCLTCTSLRMDEDSQLIVNGNARFFYGTDVYLFQGARLQIGSSYINSNCFIRVTNSVAIGNGCAIAWNVSIMDSCFHAINGVLKAAPVIIEDNVWIGASAIILPGVTIGAGSVIASGTVVKESVPPRSLVAGIPGRVVRQNVTWSM